jgi:hypothetical protein
MVVLVDEATEDRFAANPSFVEAGGGRYRRRGGVGRALVQALVGTMPVVTRRVLAKDSPRVTRSYDQDPVGQFAVQCPGEALADRIARGAHGGVLMISLASASNTASNIVAYFVSRSLIRNRSSSSRAPRSIARFRACWAIQLPVGLAVTPATCSFLVACRRRSVRTSG